MANTAMTVLAKERVFRRSSRITVNKITLNALYKANIPPISDSSLWLLSKALDFWEIMILKSAPKLHLIYYAMFETFFIRFGSFSMLIIKITISSLVIGLKKSYFPLIPLPSCYRTVCYWILLFLIYIWVPASKHILKIIISYFPGATRFRYYIVIG